MIFSERLKEEWEKRNWSQSDLGEKIHVSRQSVSKWETGKNYLSIEIIIHLSDLFGTTIDALTQKVIEHSKQLAYPKWKVFFDSLFMMGVFLFVTKIVMWILNKFAGANIAIIVDRRM